MVFSHCTTEFSRKSQQTDFCQGPGQTAGEKQDLRIRRSGVRRSRRPPGTGAQESTHPSKGAPQFSHSFGVLPEAGAGGMPPQTLAAEGSAGGRPPLGRRGLCRTPRFRAGPRARPAAGSGKRTFLSRRLSAACILLRPSKSQTKSGCLLCISAKDLTFPTKEISGPCLFLPWPSMQKNGGPPGEGAFAAFSQKQRLQNPQETQGGGERRGL